MAGRFHLKQKLKDEKRRADEESEMQSLEAGVQGLCANARKRQKHDLEDAGTVTVMAIDVFAH
jgi:hypothetical protein